MYNKKFYFTSLDKNSPGVNCSWTIDNFIKRGGVKYFGEATDNIDECDFIVYVRFFDKRFAFNVELADKILQLNKKIIIFDYMEYSSLHVSERYLQEYDILGYKVNGEFLSQLRDMHDTADELISYFFKFEVRGLIACYFKRELSKTLKLDNIGFPIYPCDFFMWQYGSQQCDSEKEFYNRPIDMFFVWGYSCLDRPMLHGSILYAINEFGNVATSEKQLDHFLKQKKRNIVVVCRCEEYERMNLKTYLPLCKTVVDVYGAGIKCFRNMESALNSVSFKQDPSVVQHAYPWEDGKNCIYLPTRNNRLNIEASVNIIFNYIRGDGQCKLFEIYKESQNTAIKYLNRKYTEDYIFPKIKNLLTK